MESQQTSIPIAQPIPQAPPIQAQNVQPQIPPQNVEAKTTDNRANLKKKALFLLLKQMLKPNENNSGMIAPPPIEPIPPESDNTILPDPNIRSPIDIPEPTPTSNTSNLTYQEPSYTDIGPNQKIPSSIGDSTSPNPGALGYLYLDGRRVFNFMPELFNIREQY